MEDHLLLRVPDELKTRISSILNVRNTPDSSKEEIYYEKESGRNYLFVIGKDKYYAVLKDLPTIVESHKTVDKISYYKVADIHQILEVSNVKETENSRRPKFDDIDNSPYRKILDEMRENGPIKVKKRKADDYVMDSGLSRPTFNIKEKFNKLDDDSGIDPRDVKRIDSLLVEIEHELSKREKAGDDSNRPFVYEELVDEEPFMEYWDEVTILDQGKDNFITSTKKAYDKAYARYLEKQKKQKVTKENSSLKTQQLSNNKETEKKNITPSPLPNKELKPN